MTVGFVTLVLEAAILIVGSSIILLNIECSAAIEDGLSTG